MATASTRAHDGAVAVRRGEHACCRVTRTEDRLHVVAAIVGDGLRRGHRVVYVCDADDVSELTGHLAARDTAVRPAIASGQLLVRPASRVRLRRGGFDADTMLGAVRQEHHRALADGYPGLILTTEMTSALTEPPAADALVEYERRLAELVADGTLTVLCQYDPRAVPVGSLAEVAAVHGVDIAPELAPIVRTPLLTAATTGEDRAVRLAGELDFNSAGTVADVLDAHYHGALRIDLSEVTFIDVSGMRALRGRTGQPIAITGASAAVRRMLSMLGWEHDPAVEIGAVA